MDGIGPDSTILRLNGNDHIHIVSIQGNGSRTADRGSGVCSCCQDIDRGNRGIHNQVIGLRIPVEAGRQYKSIYRKGGQFVVGTSVSRRCSTGLLRHIVVNRNKKFQRSLLHLGRICLGQLRSLGGRRLDIAHILMLVQIASLNIKFLQVKCILAGFYIVLPVILRSPQDGLLHRVPRPAVGAGL